MSDINIIITHKKNPYYLKYVLAQLKKSNPNANIILMGDKSNKTKAVRHALLSDYSTGAEEFAKVYKHLNSTKISYELFCYQRWFCVYEYMIKHKLSSVFALDSDVLVYDDLASIKEKIKDFECAFPVFKGVDDTPGNWIAGPPMAYFTQNGLKKLIDFFTNSYNDEKYLKLFDEKMNYHKSRGETYGVCDMTQIYLFARENKKIIFDFFEPFEIAGEKVKIDDTILNTQGYKSENFKKQIVDKNGAKYAIKDNGEEIRFPLLHFQGYCPINAKEFILDFYEGDGRNGGKLNIIRYFDKFKLNFKFKRIMDKILKKLFLRITSNDKSNKFLIHDCTKFYPKIRIKVKGKNNRVEINSLKDLDRKLRININGDNNIITINSDLKIDGAVSLSIQGNSTHVSIGRNVVISKLLDIFSKTQNNVTIGDNTSFFKTYIQNIHKNRKIKIGNDCMFSYDTYVCNSDGHPIYDKNGNKPINLPIGDIDIGNHVWVCWNACVMKNVKIADGCVLARGAIATKSIKEKNSLSAGVPAKIVKNNIKWERDDCEF